MFPPRGYTPSDGDIPRKESGEWCVQSNSQKGYECNTVSVYNEILRVFLIGFIYLFEV
jgi:hypothetical protein